MFLDFRPFGCFLGCTPVDEAAGCLKEVKGNNNIKTKPNKDYAHGLKKTSLQRANTDSHVTGTRIKRALFHLLAGEKHSSDATVK